MVKPVQPPNKPAVREKDTQPALQVTAVCPEMVFPKQLNGPVGKRAKPANGPTDRFGSAGQVLVSSVGQDTAAAHITDDGHIQVVS